MNTFGKGGLVWIVLALCLVVSSTRAEQQLVIAMVPKALDNPMFTTACDAAKDAARALGVKLIWTASQTADAAEQVAVIERLIAQRVDAIALSVNDPDLLKEPINKAIAAGIAVSTWDTDSPDSDRLFYVGTDNYAGGVKCGEIMQELLKADGKVAILTGVRGALNLEERIRGFQDAIQGTAIEVVDILAGEDDIHKSVHLVNTYTRDNQHAFDAWFFVGGWPLFVPIDTLEPVKHFPGKVVSFDTFPPMLLFVKEGIVDVLVGQDFEAMGRRSVEMLVHALRGNIHAARINSGLEIVDAANIDEVIKRKGTTW